MLQGAASKLLCLESIVIFKQALNDVNNNYFSSTARVVVFIVFSLSYSSGWDLQFYADSELSRQKYSLSIVIDSKDVGM